MKDKGRVALARIVFANREHIVAIEPWGKGMLCTTLRYDNEVRPEEEVFEGLSSPRVSKEMIDLASHILDSKAGSFNPSEFKDDYELALRKLVKNKAAGHRIEHRMPTKEKSNVIDLMEALRKSLGEPRRTRAAPARKSARKGPSRARRAGS
jgi:DNA end-binding protein Ku